MGCRAPARETVRGAGAGGQARYDTVLKLLHILGVKLQAQTDETRKECPGELTLLFKRSSCSSLLPSALIPNHFQHARVPVQDCGLADHFGVQVFKLLIYDHVGELGKEA